jgi:hypothetical protein
MQRRRKDHKEGQKASNLCALCDFFVAFVAKKPNGLSSYATKRGGSLIQGWCPFVFSQASAA